MALPVAHSLIGLALGIWRCVPAGGSLKEVLRRAWARRGELFICLLIANAPDFDLLFGLLAGSLNRYHQTVTHTLGWILPAAFFIWLYGKLARKNNPALAGGFVFLLLASHLVIDIFTADTRPPYGIMLAWPFSEAYWHSAVSVFPAPAKQTIGEIISLSNLKNAAWEALLALPVVAAVLLAKRAKSG